MNVYIYDGSFYGLLCSIYNSYLLDTKPDRISRENIVISNFIDNYISIETDDIIAQKVQYTIMSKLDNEFLKNIYLAYLNDLNYNTDTYIYKYLVLAFKIGADIKFHLHNEIVIEFNKIVKKVTLENHRFKGFVRFRTLNDNILYSKIEPDNNIIPILMPHFVKRLPNEKFIIHDTKRNIAGIYTNKSWIVDDFDFNFNNYSYIDITEKLWNVYFNYTNIKERKNYKLQRLHMPYRYWKNITELDNF